MQKAPVDRSHRWRKEKSWKHSATTRQSKQLMLLSMERWRITDTKTSVMKHHMLHQPAAAILSETPQTSVRDETGSDTQTVGAWAEKISEVCRYVRADIAGAGKL